MEVQIRNGDVFLKQTDLPQGAKRIQMDRPDVLAYGEATGHSHRIAGAVAERYEHDGRAFVLLADAGLLTHEEHGQAELPAGAYEIIIERDYDPTLYARRVID